MCLWTVAPGSAIAAAPPDSTRHNLVAIEFRDSPPQGFVIAGGALARPDSAGVFPARMMRYDPVTGRVPPPGQGVGPLLVFTDLEPGLYRVALFLFEQSATVRRLLPKQPGEPLEDFCQVYGDSLPELTFRIGRHEARYLGLVTRRTRPTLSGGSELWASATSWSPGDSARAWRAIRKRRSLAPWHGLVPEPRARGERR